MRLPLPLQDVKSRTHITEYMKVQKASGNQSDMEVEGRVAVSTSNSTIQPFSYAFGSNVQKQVVILVLNRIRVHRVTSVMTI